MSITIPSKILSTERNDNQDNMLIKFRHWIYFVAYMIMALLVAIIVLLLILLVMKQVDAIVESDHASIVDGVALAVPNTTAVPVAPSSTVELVTSISTTAEPIISRATAKPMTSSTTAVPVTSISTTAEPVTYRTAKPITSSTTAVPIAPSTPTEPVTSISTTAEPITSISTTAEPITPRTTAKPMTSSTITAVTVKAEVKRVGRPQSVTIITEKVTERPPQRSSSECTRKNTKGNECLSNFDCEVEHDYSFPYCLHSEGPRSKKICCAFEPEKREGHLQRVNIITEKMIERPPQRSSSECTWKNTKGNECLSNFDCRVENGYSFPYCLHSEGPRSKKICCACM